MANQPGVPCWIDLGVKDLASAKEFYSAVFGWEFMDTGEEFGNYNMFSKDGQMVGGMMEMGAEYEGMPVAWTVYLASNDLAESTAAVQANGGQIMMEPMRVGDSGQMTVGIDSAGAGFGLWQALDFDGFQIKDAPGAPCWFQMASKDFDKSLAFYPAVFPNLTIGGMQIEGMRYNTLQSEGEDKAGLMDANWLPEDVPSYWEIVLGVEDTDAAVANVKELGGIVTSEPMDTEWGRMANITDPQGGAFGIIQVG